MIPPWAIVACLSLSLALWKYWESICNEACPAGLALSMQFLSIALPLSAVFLIYTAMAARPSQSRRIVAWSLLTLLLAWAAFVSFVR